MQFFLDKISKLRIGWNERPLSETDFFKLCKRHKVTVEEIPLRVQGFYYCVMGRHFIAIDSKLPPREKLFVMFHEFAHYLMHAPNMNETASYHGVGKKTRKETEADMFAVVALIPKVWLETRPLAELADDEGIPPELLRDRLELFEKYSV